MDAPSLEILEAGWGLLQSGLVGNNLIHSREVGTGWDLRSLPA